MKETDSRALGAKGEKYAVKFLKKSGFKILEKNYKTAVGEVDIIARDGGEIVFAEVKTRQKNPMVPGVFAVDRKKQRNIMKTASVYILSKKVTLQPRFDIIEIEIDTDTGKPASCRHIKNAFMQGGEYAAF